MYETNITVGNDYYFFLNGKVFSNKTLKEVVDVQGVSRVWVRDEEGNNIGEVETVRERKKKMRNVFLFYVGIGVFICISGYFAVKGVKNQ